MQKNKNFELTNLSEHLFWDIDQNSLDLQKNKRIIIQRVLDYGLMQDRRTIKNDSGIDEIAKTAIHSEN